jgi:hypothetical protein
MTSMKDDLHRYLKAGRMAMLWEHLEEAARRFK